MQVIVTKEARKNYLRLPRPEQKKIKRKIKLLEETPLLGKKMAGEYEGVRVIRAWPYRIFYIVKKREKQVWIVSIVHRQDSYN